MASSQRPSKKRYGWTCICMVASLRVDHDLETAPDHPLRIERQRLGVHHAGDALVLHRFRVYAITIGARFVDDVREEHRLAGFLLHRAQERGALAPLHVVRDALAEFERAVVAPDLGHFARHRAVLLQRSLRDRCYETVNVCHGWPPVFVPSPSRGSDGSGGSRSSPPPPAECATRSGSPRSNRAPRSCRSRRGTPWSPRTGRRSPTPCRCAPARSSRSTPAAAPPRRRSARSSSPARRTRRSARRASWRGLAPRRIRGTDISFLRSFPEHALFLGTHLGRHRVAKVLRLEHLPDFDFGITRHRVRAALHPFDRLLPRLHLPKPETGDQLLCPRARPVDHRALCARETDPRALAAGMKPFACEKDARLGELLVVLAHRLQELAARHLAGLGVLGCLDHDHEAHRYLLEKWVAIPLVERPGAKSTGAGSGLLQLRDASLEEPALRLLLRELQCPL